MELISLNQTDFNVRIWLIESQIATLTSKLVDKIKIGAEDVSCKMDDLEIIQNMFEYLTCYNLNSEDNCLTECEILKIFDYLATKLKLSFKPPGYIYK